MSEPVYITISTEPMQYPSETCRALAGKAEEDKPITLRMLADRLVQAWIEDQERRQ